MEVTKDCSREIHLLQTYRTKIGNRQIKDIQSDELPQFWQKKGWSDQTRLNRLERSRHSFMVQEEEIPL